MDAREARIKSLESQPSFDPDVEKIKEDYGDQVVELAAKYRLEIDTLIAAACENGENSAKYKFVISVVEPLIDSSDDPDYSNSYTAYQVMGATQAMLEADGYWARVAEQGTAYENRRASGTPIAEHGSVLVRW